MSDNGEEVVKELRREWGVMFNDGSVSHGQFNGRTAEKRVREYVTHLLKEQAKWIEENDWWTHGPDNIRVVSRPIYAGEWEES